MVKNSSELVQCYAGTDLTDNSILKTNLTYR